LVSAIVTYVILLLFWFVSWNESISNTNIMKLLLEISLFDHFYYFAKGVIYTKSVVYFLLFGSFFLILTKISLKLELFKWK
jgi:ABC-2 type transport system permease protein